MNPNTPGGAYATRGENQSGPDDAALLARMAGGEESALGIFYDRWEGAVRAIALRLVHEQTDADDVVEEVFWQAWRQASRFEPARGNGGNWLLTIARSRALDRLRSLKRSREDGSLDAMIDAGTGEDEQDAPDPLDAAVLAERAQIVRASLATLPPEQRETLELAYLQGLSQSEIAQRTGEPLGTVKTRMRLAIMKLRERLGVLQEDES